MNQSNLSPATAQKPRLSHLALATGWVGCAALVCASACGSTKKTASDDPAIPGAILISEAGFVLPGAEADEAANANSGNGPSFAACAETVAQAEQRASDMFVMLDHTGSMGNDCPLNLDGDAPRNGSKWCYATHAFAQYFMSGEAVGNRAALQFMTVPDFRCNGGPQNGQARAAVELTQLPVGRDHELIRTLEEDGPVSGLGTRIEAALRGMTDYTAANQQSGRTMIGVLVTDGDPNGCDQNVGRLSNIIQDHLESTGIRTFVVGMEGASLNNLERLAREGGAPEHGPEFCGGQNDCHFWSVGNGDPEAFVNALEQIEAAAVVPCSYDIPEPPPGESLNSELVNVLFTAPSGNEFVIGRVDDCAASGGWVYDDPANPGLLTLCSSTCDAVTSEGVGANMEIAYGCNSVIR